MNMRVASEGSGVVWRPEDHPWTASSRLKQFMDSHGLDSLQGLMDRAAADPAWFWEAVVADLDIQWYAPFTQVKDDSGGVEWTRWFVDGKMNIAHNCVDKWATDQVAAHRPALVWEGEDGQTATYSYRQLFRAVNRLANALRDMGIRRQDRVGIFMPMIPETAVALLAAAKVGAVFIPIFSGYGSGAVAARLADAGARVLITADGFYRRGRTVEMKVVAEAALAQSPTVERVIMVPRLGIDVPWVEGRDVQWDDALAGQPDVFDTVVTEADDPVMLIYTSGTTGRPKGAVHVHSGFPIKAAQDLAHAFDLREGDVLFWYTDMGWMMGPWEVFGATLLGATMVFYEGTPDYPDPGRIWSLVERHVVTHLGISPTAIRALMGEGEGWVKRHNLDSLRVLGSTGEPWNPGPWQWFFDTVGGGRCPIINYSGGTEISGGILGCFPLTPQRPCAFTGPLPGMDIDILDEGGNPLRGKGQVGELVIRQPWVGMTRGFWQDPDRYVDTYWSRWPGIWVHGDWAEVDDDGFWYIHGRSDDTLNVAGKRLGPAELESALVGHAAVGEALAIGVPHEVKGEAAVCFVVLREGWDETDELRDELLAHVGRELSKALRPQQLYFVSDIPRTRNGKIMRRVARSAYLGKDPGETSALANPHCLDEIRGK